MTMEEYYAREIAGARLDGKDEGLAEGLKKGETQGKATGEARINNLNKMLLDAGRQDDMVRSIQDPAYQAQLLEEFGL